MARTKEYKDKSKNWRIKHTSLDTHNRKRGVTYRSTKGYCNLFDMRDDAIDSSLELLKHYSRYLDETQRTKLRRLVKNLKT